MTPLNLESVTEIASDTGIAAQNLYSWPSYWQKHGLLAPATSRLPEQWSPADQLTTVIQTAGLSGGELGHVRRDRGLYPKQFARWQQSAATPAGGRSCRSNWMLTASTLQAGLISGPCSAKIMS